VFSPYYFQSRKHGPSDPEQFCAINVALYGPIRRWAMTERGKHALERQASVFQVGPSSMAWRGNDLVISLNERCVPLPFRTQGTVTLTCDRFYEDVVALDESAKHHWQAVAPHARVAVELTSPHLSWQGAAYHDMNWGTEPLEQGFSSWTWQRAGFKQGAVVFYDALGRDGTQRRFGKHFDSGHVTAIDMPRAHALSKGLWRVDHQAYSEAPPALKSRLEDTPFYTRNHLEILLAGQRCDAIQESLSLNRFKHPLVQKMLPYRMLRRG
jgi:carotenoid 1,2-hydratase